MTWPKQTMLGKACTSPKITVPFGKEVSDVRFLTEVYIADRLAKDTSIIKSLEFNAENPNIAIAITSKGNMYKDVTLKIHFGGNETQMLADIKSRNNAYHIFKGTIGDIPLTENFEPYSVLNTPISLKHLQDQQLEGSKTNVFINKIFDLYRCHYSKINEISQLPLDLITINNLIQEELLHCVILNVLNQRPSLYNTARKISAMDFNEKYFDDPCIRKNIEHAPQYKILFNNVMAELKSKAIKVRVATTTEDHAKTGFNVLLNKQSLESHKEVFELLKLKNHENIKE
jgi:hypothetical protein